MPAIRKLNWALAFSPRCALGTVKINMNVRNIVCVTRHAVSHGYSARPCAVSIDKLPFGCSRTETAESSIYTCGAPSRRQQLEACELQWLPSASTGCRRASASSETAASIAIRHCLWVIGHQNRKVWQHQEHKQPTARDPQQQPTAPQPAAQWQPRWWGWQPLRGGAAR